MRRASLGNEALVLTRRSILSDRTAELHYFCAGDYGGNASSAVLLLAAGCDERIRS